MIMVFQDYKIEGDNITISKKELQEAHDHFCKVADKFKPRKNKEFDPRYALYLGKARTQYRIDEKIFKTKEKFLEALKDFSFKVVPIR